MRGEIHKARFETGSRDLTIPASRVLQVGEDPGGDIAAWYIAAPGARVDVHLSMTGEHAPLGRHVGTFLRGEFVLHAWARGERE